MSNFLRYRGFLVLILLFSCAFLGISQTVSEKAFTLLPQGASSTYELSFSLPQGKVARNADLTFSLPDGNPLPPGIRIVSASAKTSFAGRRPYLTAVTVVQHEQLQAPLTLLAKATYSLEPSPGLTARSGPVEPSSSILATGEFVKLAIDEDGIYQIDAAFLDELGLNGGPNEVRLYSKGGAMLPEVVGAAYPVDVQEVALLEIGNGDNTWNAGEKLLFYGQGEDVWYYHEGDSTFLRTENLYAERTHYYLRIGGTGLRVEETAPVDASTYSTSFTARARWEDDIENLLLISQLRYNSGQGSGQDWFGYQFGTSREISRPEIFNLGQPVTGARGTLRSSLAASALSSGTRYTVEVNGQSFSSDFISSSVRSNANNRFARRQLLSTPISLTRGQIDLTVSYPGNLESNPGWLDYVQLIHPCELIYTNSPLFFRALEHKAPGSYGFEISGIESSTRVLNISDPLVPASIVLQQSGSTARFGYVQPEDSAPQEFVAFDPDASYPTPSSLGTIAATANLHAIQRADMLIVYGEGMDGPAERLAEHRRSHSGLAVVTAPASMVFEEFGGGRPDPTAIRAFAKMIYDRDPAFRYLLLLGDGHFDPRGIKRAEPNLIPTYQTKGFGWEVEAFPTDDYFGLLDDGEGRNGTLFPTGLLDIAVGRMPFSAVADADALVEKIIKYDSDPATLGEWRLRTVFVADDEDSNRHINDIDAIAEANQDDFPVFNQQKIYADAFEQETTSGGIRIPRAAEAINQNMFRGNLVTSYLGHGGPNGWAQERILNFPDIEKWNNPNSYPIFITATCTFTGFDDPQREVAGEAVLAKARGGAVAMMSTVRPVYITANRILAEETHERVFNDSLNRIYSVGQLMQIAKNEAGSNTENNRKYSFFGDPAMYLGRPLLQATITSFDSVRISPTADTAVIGPLNEFSVAGVVSEPNGLVVTDFDGEVVLTVYGQERVGRTLGQDAGSTPRTFSRIGSTLFSGRARVENGRFSAKLMLPKDISLERGQGRMSIYVKSPDGRDGAGLFNRFVIDGRLAPGIIDDTPPEVSVFLGNEEFVAGGTTNEDPVIVVKLVDDTGINVSGVSIGHDLTASLQGAQESSYILNDFYQSTTDDYTSGEARFPVFDLAQGEYQLDVRAWDLANNSGTGKTSFVVADNAEFAIDRVLNYPNPFVDATCFQFEHNSAGIPLEVQIDIYTTSGRLVRSLAYQGTPSGYRFGNEECIRWDGTDEFGQALARGVYLYKVSLYSSVQNKRAQSDFEKLVVLK